jgi:hypothetical protein
LGPHAWNSKRAAITQAGLRANCTLILFIDRAIHRIKAISSALLQGKNANDAAEADPPIRPSAKTLNMRNHNNSFIPYRRYPGKLQAGIEQAMRSRCGNEFQDPVISDRFC